MIRATFPLSALVLALGLATTSPGMAQDGGLYADVPDPNASFVRVVAADLTTAMVASTSFDAPPSGVTGYVMVPQPGEVNIMAGAAEATVTIEAGKYYSYVVGADGTGTLVAEDVNSSPAQAGVTFFNLSDLAKVDLYVPAAKAVAVAAVAANSSGSVALKAPLSLEFEVRDGDKILATLPAIDLKRRAGLAIVFKGAAGSYAVSKVDSTLAN